MATIYIDGQPYEADERRNLLEVCLSLGFDLPYFCWHPAMGSVGACRQCAVKQYRDESDTKGRLVMACMGPASEGTRISIADAEAKEFRESVIEWLMVNHPHDCPICDEGGECHLQDMTVMTGHNYRDFRFKKRTYRNQDLGPFINHEMNRCIQCYRCVRFYREYAGGRDLDAFGAHDRVYFGRHEDGTLENEFSGNLVEVCPTGVFTDKTLKEHYTRKWDMQTAPSVCTHCGVGCNTIPGERYGYLRRILNRYNGEVNRYFLCDRGRYGYEFVNDERRLRQPLLRTGSNETPQVIGRDATVEKASSLLRDRQKVVGIGSPRASLEANFALRTLVGEERFCSGMSDREHGLVATALNALQNGPARSPSLYELQQCDAVLVLGEDVTNTAPMVALNLRQAVRQQPMQIPQQLGIPAWHDAAARDAIQDERGPCIVAAPHDTRLDDIATETYRAAPDDLARLGFAVAAELSGDAPRVDDLSDEVRALAGRIAEALKTAKRPAVVSGTGCRSEAVLQAAANVAWALCDDERTAELCLAVPECNSLGAGLLGGGRLADAVEAVQSGTAETVVILENDLYRRADEKTVNSLLEAASNVIVVDHLQNRTAERADFLFPGATFAEGDGTFVNNEGRAQRFYQVFVPQGDIQESWRWLRELMTAAGRTEVRSWTSLDEIVAALAEAFPVFREVPEIAPPAGFRAAGAKIPRQSHRYSGRTAMYADKTVHEPPPPDDPDSPLSFSMEGYLGEPPSSALISRFWSPGWNSVQSVNKFQSEVGGHLHGGDPGRRLIEPSGERPSYFDSIPQAFRPRDGEWLVVPVHHIFGSEELSVLTPGVAERSPAPYAAIHPDDAGHLQTGDGGGTLDFAVDGVSYQLPVRTVSTLPRGVVGLPLGLPGVAYADLPAWSTISVGAQT